MILIGEVFFDSFFNLSFFLLLPSFFFDEHNTISNVSYDLEREREGGRK